MDQQRAPSSPELYSNIGASLSYGMDSIDIEPSFVHVGNLPHSYREELNRGYTSGWRTLDKYLQGIRTGEVTVITADTGAGKTSFALHLILNCAMQGKPVWINSWEMKPEVILRKIASIALREPLKYKPFNQLNNVDFDEWCAKYKIYVNTSTQGTDLLTLNKQLKKAKNLGVEVVMLDHLDYLISTRKDKLHEAIDETVKTIHEYAFALNMHIILICHPRQSGTAAEGEVGMHSLKGSSSIKQYADNVLVLHRCARTDPSVDPCKLKVRVAKNRMFGIEGNAFLYYQPLWDGYLELNETTKGAQT